MEVCRFRTRTALQWLTQYLGRIKCRYTGFTHLDLPRVYRKIRIVQSVYCLGDWLDNHSKVRPARLRGPSSFLFNEYRGQLPRRHAAWARSWWHLHLVPILRKSGAITPYPICLHGAHRASVTFTLYHHGNILS
jgi:hypothetical protein